MHSDGYYRMNAAGSAHGNANNGYSGYSLYQKSAGAGSMGYGRGSFYGGGGGWGHPHPPQQQQHPQQHPQQQPQTSQGGGFGPGYYRGSFRAPYGAATGRGGLGGSYNMGSFHGSTTSNSSRGHVGMQRHNSFGSFTGGFGSFRSGGLMTSSNPGSSAGGGAGLRQGNVNGSYGGTSLLDMHGQASGASTGAPPSDTGSNSDAGGDWGRAGSLYSLGSFANGMPATTGQSGSYGAGGGAAGNNRGYQQNVSAGNRGYYNSTAITGHGGDSDSGDVFNLQRQDSQNMLQRKYSIAGGFYNFADAGQPAGPTGGYHNTHSNNINVSPSNGGNYGPYAHSPQNNAGAMPMGGMGMPMGMGVVPGFRLNGRNGGVVPSGGMPGFMGGQQGHMQHQQMMQQQQQQQQQRRLGGGGVRGDENTVQEGQPTALGRKNSHSNLLERKDSQKRIGMYFKNKEATQDDVEYKKDGDPGTTKTASSKSRDPSLVNNVKPILLLDIADHHGSDAVDNDIEIDGKTVRAVKPGGEEVQRYDMREIIFVDTSDVDVTGDALDELRDQFCNGANCSMLMADAECPAGEPTRWFSWNALKSVMKSVFARIDGYRTNASSSGYEPKLEVTVSLCVLQDDQMLDLLGEDSNFDNDVYKTETLVVAESPLFGNVPNNAVFVVVDSAGDFNDTLDACLERARGFFHHEDNAGDNMKNLDDVEEYGIILATVVLKQTRKSPSSGKIDVIVSSIFASGVGDGIIHYNRIMDKNPAEPRALFYSVLHRSCHSTAVVSLNQSNPEVFNALTTLQRFSKVELRKPKMGSVRQFLYYADTTVPRIKDDLAKMKEGRQKTQMQRYLERLQLMAYDMEEMMDDPEHCVPKTYI